MGGAGDAGGFNSFAGYKSNGWYSEATSARFRQAVAAELFATALFVAVGTMAVMYSADEGPVGTPRADVYGTLGPAGSPATLLGVLVMNFSRTRWALLAMVFGFMICILVFSTGAISGGNLNPAVTTALYLSGKMSALRWMSYMVAQCLGAVAGAAWARSLSPSLFNAVGGAINTEGNAVWITSWTVIGGEMMGTALLVWSVVTAADAGREKANKYVGALTPVMIGLSVLIAHFFLIPIDGCSINPARSFGSVVVLYLSTGNASLWDDQWIFWVGPLVGGPTSALIYYYCFSTQLTTTAKALLPPPPQVHKPGEGPASRPDASNEPANPFDAPAYGGSKRSPSPARSAPNTPPLHSYTGAGAFDPEAPPPAVAPIVLAAAAIRQSLRLRAGWKTAAAVEYSRTTASLQAPDALEEVEEEEEEGLAPEDVRVAVARSEVWGVEAGEAEVGREAGLGAQPPRHV